MRKLYCELSKKKKEIVEDYTPTYLYQSDFNEGTYLIEEPGYYILKEDIVFNPNPNDDYMPRPDQEKYNKPGFSLGFFAVISISAKDVYLDLNGYSISASEEFTLQQRFFSIIELANSPFIFGQGPGDFSTQESFKSAENVIIRKGLLGRSSHHGIHGNMAQKVLLEKLTVTDFEFIGIALNGSNNVVAHKLDIKKNRMTPVLATYSAARFSRMFAKRLLSMDLLNQDERYELGKKLLSLEFEMNNTFNEIMKTGKTTSELFRNDSMLPDGNVYGFLVKNKGVAVNEFESSGQKVENVFLRKVNVEKLKCRVDEVICLTQKNGKGAVNDVAGAVLQIDKIKDQNGVYKGTVLSDLQLYLAELSLNLNMPLGKSNISQDIIDWAKSGQSIDILLNKGYKYKSGGDSMQHLAKAAISYRFDAIQNLSLEKCSFYKIKNYACLGNEDCPTKHDASKRKYYSGNNVTGINISYCSEVEIYKFNGEKLFSKDGDATGINVIFNSKNVRLVNVKLSNIKAGTLYKGRWVGETYYGKHINYENVKVPNKKPQSVGIRYENNAIIQFRDVCISDLHSCETPVKILKV